MTTIGWLQYSILRREHFIAVTKPLGGICSAFSRAVPAALRRVLGGSTIL